MWENCLPIGTCSFWEELDRVRSEATMDSGWPVSFLRKRQDGKTSTYFCFLWACIGRKVVVDDLDQNDQYFFLFTKIRSIIIPQYKRVTGTFLCESSNNDENVTTV